MNKSSILSALTATVVVLSSTLVAGETVAQQVMPETLDLQTAVQFAVNNNFSIRQARERIRQQEGVEIEVRSGQLPSLVASAGGVPQ